MNCINADSRYFQLMSSWLEDGKDEGVDFRFPFKDFTIKYTDGSSVHIICKGAKRCEIPMGLFTIRARVTNDNLVADSLEGLTRKDPRLVVGVAKMLKDIYKIILYFVAKDKSCSYSRDLEHIEELGRFLMGVKPKDSKVNTSKTVNTNTNKKTKNIIRIGITRSFRKRASSDIKRHYERVAETWGVRGHYRKYKSGKVVWIEPFAKGKGNLKDREYILR